MPSNFNTCDSKKLNNFIKVMEIYFIFQVRSNKRAYKQIFPDESSAPVTNSLNRKLVFTLWKCYWKTHMCMYRLDNFIKVRHQIFININRTLAIYKILIRFVEVLCTDDRPSAVLHCTTLRTIGGSLTIHSKGLL